MPLSDEDKALIKNFHHLKEWFTDDTG